MKNKLPAGRYWIGDPCYVLGHAKHEDWLEILEKTNYFDGDGYELGGHTLWGHGTAYGDGLYEDQLGNEYGVDAGLLAVVPEALIGDMKEAGRLGQFHDFEHDFMCEYRNGTFNFGDLVFIKTGSDEGDY